LFDESQYSSLWQSLSFAQPPPGMHTSVVALQVAERHTSGRAGTHGPEPFGRPHLPSPEQTLLAQSTAPAQLSPFGSAHVSVTGLHSPLAHAAAVPLLQLPPWMPSLGSGLPAGSFAAQVY
jgi:hypothetical protein